MIGNILARLLKPDINENPFIYEIQGFKPLNYLRFLRGNKSVAKLYCGERIVEYPFVFRNLPVTGSKIFEFGAAKSALAFSLACLGYRVTALDIRDYEFSHPNLRFVRSDIFDFDTNERFDCVICVSTIEHVGFGHYGDSTERDDVAAMRKLRKLLKPYGILLLTTHFGEHYVGDWFRVYDSDHLSELLRGFYIEAMEFYMRSDSYVWKPTTMSQLEKIDCSEPKHGVNGIVCVKGIKRR
jgi:SAM-dependent methyltransferase